MSEITMYKRIIPGSLKGFTLFEARRDGKDVWQLSYRQESREGWSVHHIEESTARRFLDMLSGVETESPSIIYLKDQIDSRQFQSELQRLLDQCARTLSEGMSRAKQAKHQPD